MGDSENNFIVPEGDYTKIVCDYETTLMHSWFFEKHVIESVMESESREYAKRMERWKNDLEAANKMYTYYKERVEKYQDAISKASK